LQASTGSEEEVFEKADEVNFIILLVFSDFEKKFGQNSGGKVYFKD
tara:strand:+ start:331 stop:468 length:138 start_codon:yes stop_codon:yes gene_type:complete